MNYQSKIIIKLLFFFLLLENCNDIIDDKQEDFNIMPLEGVIKIFIEEFHHCYHSTCLPQITLFFRTENIYPNCNNSIELQLSIDKNEIYIDIQGILVPEIQLTAIGPASSSKIIEVKPGDYTIYITYAENKDTYLLTVTDSSFCIKEKTKTFTIFQYKNVWRYKVNSFVYKCQKYSTDDSCDCIDFYEIIKSMENIQEFHYPNNGISPYDDISNFFEYNMTPKYFLYNQEEDFDKIIDEATKFPNRGGIRLKSWLNKNYP